MDMISIVMGIVGLVIGVLSGIIAITLLIKPIIQESLEILRGLKSTIERQGEVLTKISEQLAHNSEDHIQITSSLEIYKQKIVSETTDKVVERIKDLFDRK